MRLIDADALLRPISSYDPVKYTHEYGYVVTVQDVKSIPTIDAVPVVRCKDCTYYRGGYCKYIYHMSMPHPRDFFCGWAERRDDADKSVRA